MRLDNDIWKKSQEDIYILMLSSSSTHPKLQIVSSAVVAVGLTYPRTENNEWKKKTNDEP